MKALKGLYLVIDPMEDFDVLEPRILQVLRGGVGVIQVWDHWGEDQDRKAFIRRLLAVAGDIPVLVNNDLELAGMPGVKGIHLDRPEDIARVSRDKLIVGVTLSGAADWKMLKQAGVDYVSFCSMFPSSSTDACELVDFQTVREACKNFPGSVFASGGINLNNAHQILELGVSGIALISGLLKAEDPFSATKKFNDLIERR